MNILLTGATGFIGSHLLRALTASGHRVRACVRNPVAAAREFNGPDYIHCDFSRDIDVALWHGRLERIDVIINAVGIIRETRKQRFDILHRDTPIALFRAAAECGVKRVIQISALGADASSQSHYHLSKRSADDTLCGLPLDWVILRPSIVYGAGAKSMSLFRALAALPVTPMVADGRQPLQPIHIDDLVHAVQHCVEHQQTLRKTIDLVGPEPIAMHDMLQRQRNWLGLGRLHPLMIPYKLALPLASLAGFFGNAPISKETVTMLQRGNVGDVKPFIDWFGFQPRAMRDVLTTPASQADRWHAGLFFLRPLLRVSIALLWIFTGLISAFFFPAQESYALLAQTGITGFMAPVLLYGAAAIDTLLGLAILFRQWLRPVVYLQIAIILGYSLIISVTLPEFWLHPFGPVSKNIPLLISTMMMLVMEKQ